MTNCIYKGMGAIITILLLLQVDCCTPPNIYTEQKMILSVWTKGL